MKHALALLSLSALALASCSSATAERQEAGGDSERVVHQEIVAHTSVAAYEGEVEHAPDTLVAAEPEAQPVAQSMVAAEPELELELDPEPIGRRIARKKLTIYAKPTASAPIRGRIPMAAAFDVYGYVEGEGCEGDVGWADLGHHGYACMTNTRPGEGAKAYPQPKMRAELTPYFYAKVKAGKSAPMYRNLKALKAGDEPIATLKKGVDYAFSVRRRVDGEIILLDDKRRAVRERDVRRFQPSRFEGRDLEAKPVPEGKILAWASIWPETPAYTGTSTKSAAAASVGYHDELLLEPTDKEGWYALDNGSFVSAKNVRLFAAPTERPSEVGKGDVWVDVDLEQQVLTVMLGDEAIFATLVSSGLKSPTPRGLFRIHNKRAVGSMSSSPGADDFYDVQAVPHVQYFLGSFALHSAYWHNGFGRPISHGCVNLSPKDAKHVFSLTTPVLPNGWLHGYESTEHLGTTVRIHKGDQPIRDRRGEVEPVYGF